ncbi:E3 ubiquitin-protein ligase MYCBP2 [Acipenser ruthenus]|uniref:E3 ubiquitin-protein ligase MYCBP2 n=1 Tax=Acipenser ruthenus TaxID=7906 RepID=A0A444TXB4_ACIRT|nr:E3 ubiquitin-protein ligase MYCBP2 [Acipenser ruthenus]
MGACPGIGAQSDCRGRYQLLLSGRALAERYRRIYTAAISDKEQGINQGRGKKALNKKKLKRKQKVKSKAKTRTKTENLDGTVSVPDIKLHSNPSAFNVYCNVRHCVLDWQQKEASLALASKNSVQSGESDSDEEEESKEPAFKLPKIIGIGLCGVFELIKETRFSHPSLCLRTLQALLGMLQGQQPEGFQSEPPEVLESLFHLLLETTIRSAGVNDSTGQALTALSCACLFSLVVSWGDTGKILQAVSAILTNNGSHACQTIQVPTILIALQRSVQAVLVGKVQIQDWFGNGIKKAALMNKWVLKEVSIDDDDQCLLQSDGSFLYLLCKDGLYKVGSGYSGTVRGHVYNSTSRIQNRKEKKSWLGYAQGCLLYRDLSSHSMTAVKINPETLEQEGAITMPGLQADAQNIVFTDGEYINQIAACRDDGFVVRIYATSTEPELQQELQLKLARKCLHACGISLFDLEKDLHIMCTGFDEEAAVLGAGREFALMKTIYYTGKYQSLGIKQGGPSAGKWVELPITKSPKVIQFSVGHDGSHALLVAEDGSVFFTGSASKGEDGESSIEFSLVAHSYVFLSIAKSRRQPKPYKPKKMLKVDGKTAVYTACNNGSSSIVTKDGELYMFGKDAVYSDSSCQVTDLKGRFVTQVAMGKAHTCVLTKDGEVWTFGVNNKGQCGRDTGSMSQAGKAGFGIENMATAMDEDLEEELDEKEEKSMMCQPGMHKWKLDQCMVCTVCGDCTGYGSSCVSSGRPDRVPGGICGCGSGESGCSACGCCKACARELDGQEARQRGIFDAVKEMIPLDLLLDGSGERGDKDASKITTYPPGAVRFDCALRAVQVSCGFHHSVVLMENGDVYTFGYGQHGQLGQGDVNSRSSPTLVQALPGPSIHVTAGSNHTAVLLMDGQVFTFGSFSKGQLGRPIIDMPYWNAKPSPMPNIGAKYGRKATWIGASGDQTFLRIDEALINSHVLATSEIFASKHIIGHGGGWGYSAHSVEAIRFCADADILLGGLGLFGGRGEYTAKIKLFELGPDGGDHETDGDLLAETDVLAYDCAAREKYAMMFDEPVLLQSGWWYVAWARVSGPSSDCGSHGQATITTDDGVVFQFKSSKKSNNGTDVNAGQIPQLLYRLPSNDGNAAKGKQQTSEPVHILKRSFARTVSVECFESLLSILHWSWTTLVLGVEELRGLKGFQYTATLLDLERLRFVGTCCLRLLRVYICEIYPISASTKSAVDESSKLADCVGKTRSLLRKILSEGVDNCMIKLDNDPEGYLSQPLILLEAVLQECHHTFTACFHSFYPTPALQWACLCDLLNCLDQDIQEANFRTSSSRLLAAVMSALCNTSVKLTSILPIAYDGEVLLRSLVKQAEENPMGMTSFREVLEKMLVIVVLPVRKSLRKEVELFSPHLVSNTCGLLASIVSELTASALGSEVDGLNCLHSVKSTPNRFTKTSQGRSWNTGNGSPDAICFTVDRHGVVLVGFCVYGGGGVHEYELEVLADDAQTEHPGDSAHSHRWTSLEMVKGTYTTDDSPSDIAEIRLDKAVPLKESVKYAVRLRNYGSRTANGDGGMTTVQCTDGVTFTFSTCSLSSNGTNQTRGQIPQILYYRSEYDGDLQSQLVSKANEEDKNCNRSLSVVSVVVQAAKDLLHRAFAVDAEDIPELLSSSSLFSMLLPLILAYIGPVAASVPKAAVEVFGLVQELLPAVSALNQKYAPPAFNPNQSTDSTTGNQPEQGLSASTTSNHYSVTESDHPYKQASVTQYKVSFPDCVQWMTIEFDPQCGTAQPEDVLRLMIPSKPLQVPGFGSKHSTHESLNTWTELKKFSGSCGWPTTVLVLPGNEALFSLETASDYVKDEKASFYGFKCVAVGYEFNPGSDEGIIQLEKELAYLGSVCAAALMKKDLALSIGNELEEDLEILEEASLQVCKAHAGILGKGLALSRSPSILEALEGNLPLHLQSNEHSFLEDFITCVQNSSGGRLARWLQPDSYADPQKTSLLLNKDDIKCGWPTTVTVQTKDQYGDVVHVPNMKVEVKAVPVSQKKSLQQGSIRKLQRIPGSPASAASGADMTFGGLPAPKLEATYEPMIVKEARYIAITMMKAYENYSFEELRFASPTPKRPSENMLIRANTDGTYGANWTPGAVGLYTIHVTIDGIEIDAGLEVEVKDPPKGMIPPGAQIVKPKAEPQPSKVRKFVAKDSAGLRVRSHPSLQSEQIGIVKVNGTITFIDEIHNDDGVWLRLNDETVKKYVPNMNGYTEAWCLSFNQHLGRSLLVPVDESRMHSDDYFKEVNARRSHEVSVREQDRLCLHGGPGVYKVTNSEGTWVQLDKNSIVEFCESDEGEAWSLARDRGGNQYLRHEEEQVILDQGAQTPPPSPFSIQAFNRDAAANGAQGYDYGISNNKGDQLSAILNSVQSRPFLPAPSVFEQAAKPPSSLVHSPFVFGQSLSFQQPLPQPQLPSKSVCLCHLHTLFFFLGLCVCVSAWDLYHGFRSTL